jgi:hypothetical protein
MTQRGGTNQRYQRARKGKHRACIVPIGTPLNLRDKGRGLQPKPTAKVNNRKEKSSGESNNIRLDPKS